MKILKLVGSDKYIEYISTYEDELESVDLTRDIEEALDISDFRSETLAFVAKEIKEQYDCRVQVMEVL